MSASRRYVLFTVTALGAAVLAACGGGGGGGDSGSTTPTVPPAARPAALSGSPTVTMSCVAEPVFTAAGATVTQCSGATALRTENGVTLTSSGVQAWGISTSDLATPNLNPGGATGFRLSSGIPDGSSLAEMRIGKSSQTGDVRRIFMLLDNLGVSWDGVVKRPPIIETFETTRGRTSLAGNGSVVIGNSATLPTPPNAGFYDNVNSVSGTKENYANNRYFTTATPCTTPSATQETCGLSYTAGTSGDPDRTAASRRHGEGDVRAGNAGGLTASGTKGFRNLTNFSYAYANMATWITQETDLIDEWTLPAILLTENTKNRRGFVAYGDTTAPASVPATGSVIFNGIAYGFYTPNGEDGGSEPVQFRAAATMLVDFSTGQALIEVKNATQDGTATALPVTFQINAGIGAPGTNVANYLTGAIANGGAGMSGGLGGRFFGPAAAEIGGTFTLQNTTTKAAVLGGFIARR